MIKISLLPVILAMIISLAAGCGSGSSASDGRHAEMSVNISDKTITGTTADVPINADIKLSCETDDLFSSTCKANKAIINMGSYKNEVPLNIKLSGNNSKVMALPVFSQSDLLMPPFLYLFDENPSNAVTRWSSYNEVIGETRTELIGKTTEACITKEIPPSNPCPPDLPEEETPSGENENPEEVVIQSAEECSDIPQTVTECTPDRTYELALPPYTPGTLKIIERTNYIGETALGYLTGNGNGYVANGVAHIMFDYDPPKDSDIIAVFISPLKPLDHMPYGNDVKLTYGFLVLNQSGDLFVDSRGEAYATISGNAITFVKAAGNSGAPMIVSYSGEPYMTSGGEFAGYGDGVSTVYPVKTKYAPLKPDTFRVFTPEQPGEILSANPATGEILVEFERAPRADERIMVSYVLARAATVIGVTIVTDSGNSYFDIPIEITK